MKRFAFGLAGLLTVLSLVLTSASAVLAGVTGPTVSGLTLSASSVVAGKTVIGTVKLSAKVATGDSVLVSLSSADPTVASVPSTVTVGAGKQTATFNIKTKGVDSAETVAITAAANASEKSANLKVNPAVLSTFTLTKSIAGGSSVNGTVTLNGVAPADGVVVSLESTDEVNAKVPASVKVASGKSSATFALKTKAVEETTTATITAEAGTVSKSVTVTIKQAELASLVLNRTEVTGGSTSTLTATITLTSPAPAGGLEVALSVSDEDVLYVPESVTIPANGKTLNVKVVHASVAAATTETVTAELNDKTKSDTISVVKASVSSVAVSPTTVVGGTDAVGTVKLDAPAPEGGLKVTLKSNSAKAKVPASVTVPEGERSVTFDIETLSVTSKTAVKITAGPKFIVFTIKP